MDVSATARPEAACSGKIAFVTGGTGFIGSHLVEELHRRGYAEVRALVRSKPRWLEGLDVVHVRGQLADTPELRSALRGVDYVYHVGGVTRARDWQTFEKANIDDSMLLLKLIEEESPDVKKVLMTSSLAVVGECDTAVATETVPLRPVSDYGRSKELMERAIARYQEAPGALPIVVVRPPAVYGPREADIFEFFKTLSRGIAPVVGSGNEPALTLVHARDLVRGMVDAAESDRTTGRTYFIGSDRAYTWNEIKNAAGKALGKRALTITVPDALIAPVGAVVEMFGRLTGTYPPLNREKAREIRDACKICSSARARRDFGYAQQVGLEEGIEETIRWYRTNEWL